MLGGGLAAQASDRDAALHPAELLRSDADCRAAWQELVANDQRRPDWLLNLDGQSTPMQAPDAGDQR